MPGLAIAAAAVVCSFIVDAIAIPRPSLDRPLAALMLHVAAVALVICASLSLTGRPIFSTVLVVVLIALLAVIGNAKYESLREPFVFTDLTLFSQAFAHPRLYLPFLGIDKALAIVVGVAAAATGFVLETPIGMLGRCVSGVLAVSCVPLCLVLARRLSPTLHPEADQLRFGFLASFVTYLINGLGRAEKHAFARAVDSGPFANGRPETRPDVIVIQSESYFDARRMSESILSGPYVQFDRARRESFEQGQLTVPAWGANTMRSEFALLTGLPSTALRYARFYPYLYVRRVCASIAGYFSRGGYLTAALHPYYADFFGRRRAFRFMQFDRFLSIENFDDAPRVGPYIGDAGVTDAIIGLLQECDDRPVFAFAITMENHGPLHLEPVAAGESDTRHSLGDDARWRDLTAYLRHIENADKMIGRLTDYLRKRKRPAVLCFYGDHVPALSSVFDALASEPIHSDYLIWRNFGNDPGTRRDVPVETLGCAIQRAMMLEDRIEADPQTELQQTPA